MEMEKAIVLKNYDGEIEGEVLPSRVARNIKNTEQFAHLLDTFLNMGGKNFSTGKSVGEHLRTTHRTLQRLAVCFALGILCGISEQEYTDPRNETAIATAKKIKQMVDDNELPMGMHI